MKLSVLMSAYNEDIPIFKQAVDSILNQTYSDFEFIIILDNPNNINLREEIMNYAALDHRIVYIENAENLGLPRSLNKGLSVAQGEYIARMDADDISVPDRFNKEIDYLENHANCAVVSSDRIDIDEGGKIINDKCCELDFEWQVIRALPYGCELNHPSVMFRKDAIVNLGGYRDIAFAEDYDLWLRVLTSQYDIGFIFDKLLLYRVRNNSISVKNRYAQLISSFYVLELYRERLKKGFDFHSRRNQNEFLKKYKYDDAKNLRKFNRSRERYLTARNYIKGGKTVKGLLILTMALLSHRAIRKRFRMTIGKRRNTKCK